MQCGRQVEDLSRCVHTEQPASLWAPQCELCALPRQRCSWSTEHTSAGNSVMPLTVLNQATGQHLFFQAGVQLHADNLCKHHHPAPTPGLQPATSVMSGLPSKKCTQLTMRSTCVKYPQKNPPTANPGSLLDRNSQSIESRQSGLSDAVRSGTE